MIGGTIRVFKYKQVDPVGPKRTHERYLIDVEETQKVKEPVNGIKGYTPLSHLKYFKPTYSTCIDYMHSLLEGVLNSLFKFWFSPEHHDKPFSLRKYMREIEIRLLSIKPPTFVTTPPRSIYCWQEWRAHEFLYILFCIIPFHHFMV